jgi:hypothetical protein
MRKRTWIVFGCVIAAVIVVAVILDVKAKRSVQEKVVIPAGWQSYENADYGFSLAYPANWQIFTGLLKNDVPEVVLGDPIEGTTTYALDVLIKNNTSTLSSDEYVADMLSKLEAENQANGTGTPSAFVQFVNASGSDVTVAGNDGYELNDVFEFDHNAEQIYVAHNNKTLVFDFPVVDTNPNISSSTENNAIAHEIVNTLSFTK